MEVAFASPCDSRHEPRVKVQLGDNYQITSEIGNASIREAQTQMSPSNAAFCHCFPPPEAHRVYCQCQPPRGLPAAPRKAGGSHIPLRSLHPPRGSCPSPILLLQYKPLGKKQMHKALSEGGGMAGRCCSCSHACPLPSLACLTISL